MQPLQAHFAISDAPHGGQTVPTLKLNRIGALRVPIAIHISLTSFRHPIYRSIFTSRANFALCEASLTLSV